MGERRGLDGADDSLGDPIRFGPTYADVGSSTRRITQVLAGILLPLLFGVPGAALTGLVALDPAQDVAGWVPLVVLGGAVAIGLLLWFVAGRFPMNHLDRRVVFSAGGLRWNWRETLQFVNQWRSVGWDEVATLQRIRHVAADPSAAETHGVAIVLRSGGWSLLPDPRFRDFWFRAVNDARRRGMVPEHVELVGFDLLPPPGAPVEPSERPPPERPRDVRATRLPRRPGATRSQLVGRGDQGQP